jgi:cytochrome c peroxidase
MSADAVRGLDIFRTRGQCILCHGGPFFSDFAFHNLSTSPPDQNGQRADEGRFLVTGQETDRGRFRTPTLRSAYDTAPYFHDGSAVGLRAVLTHLASAAVTADPNHDAMFNQPLALSDQDMDDLIAFIAALRGQPVGDQIVPPIVFP